MRTRNLSLPCSALVLTLASLHCPNLSAQTPPATPTPAPTVRVFSNEVLVYVDVSDDKGNPVHGLTRSEFTVLENNRPIALRSFNEHRDDEQGPAPNAQAPALPAPPNTFTNAAPPEGPLPLTILLLDSLDTPMANQILLDKQISGFADKLRPGARVAIFTLSGTGQLSLLQGFTSDPLQLKRAAKSVKTQIPPLEDAGQDASNTDSTNSANNLSQPPTNATPSLQEPVVDQTVECNKAASRVRYTANAFGEIARFTAGMPGRKNLIWFSGVFPMGMRDKQGTQCYTASEDLASADDLLERAHVVVYPVDPRALDIIARYGTQSRLGTLQSAEHLTMERIAEQTGGKAYYNTNDLAAAATQAIGSGLDYYALTYAPTNQNWDTRKRNISVTVDKPGLTLVYKHSYNAYAPGMTVTPTGRPYATTTPQQSAMMRGTPQFTEVTFHVSVAPAAATETALPPGNTADPKMKPPYRRLTLAYNIDLNGIKFDLSPDGNYHGQFEYAVNVYDASDKLLNTSTMAAKPGLPPAVYQSMLTSGAKVHQDIAIPAKGDYILRIGVHDLTTDRVGAIEIPTASLTP